MKMLSRATLFALFAAAGLAGLTGPAAAAVCSDGATKIRNSIQYTCVCTRLSNGEKACLWQAD